MFNKYLMVLALALPITPAAQASDALATWILEMAE